MIWDEGHGHGRVVRLSQLDRTKITQLYLHYK